MRMRCNYVVVVATITSVCVCVHKKPIIITFTLTFDTDFKQIIYTIL